MNSATENPYNDILSWSENIASWQSDALRRMFAKNTSLDAVDKEELFNFFINSDEKSLIPLTGEHIPSIIREDEQTLKIKSISNICGVNRLSSNETLEFKTGGVTVIYGENGSGKTGYSRIIKKIAGQKITILPDVYDSSSPSKSAKIKILQNGKEIDIAWQGESIPELKNLAIFDSDVEPEYTKKEGKKIDVLPYNLWVFSELSNLCGEFEEKRKAKITLLENENQRWLEKIHFPFSVESPFHKSITLETTDQEIEKNTQWTDADKEQFEFLIKNDVLSVIQEIEKNIPEIQKNLDDCKELLLENKILEYNKICIALQQAKKQQSILADNEFREEKLKGVGKEAWLLMYNSAKEYSEKFAYTKKSFPYTKENSKCVLCQQPLEDEAKQRFQKFDDFIQQKVIQERVEKENALKKTKENIEQLKIIEGYFVKSIFEKTKGIFSENKEIIKSLENLPELFNHLHNRKKAVLQKIEKFFTKTDNSEELWKLNPLDFETSILEFLPLIETKKDILKKEDNSTQKQNLEKRQTYFQHKDNFFKIRNNLVEIEKLKKLKSQLSTSKITTKSKELVQKYITGEFKGNLEEHLKKLGVKSVTITSPDNLKASKGNAFFSLILPNVVYKDIKIRDVLSEGETRAISLAFFLAEIQTLKNNAPIIFDDPVSSLDNERRKKVAEAIIKFCKENGNQLIVFTHDIIFYDKLFQSYKRLYRDNNKIKIKQVYVYSIKNNKDEISNSGFLREKLPFEKQKPDEQISTIKNYIIEQRHRKEIIEFIREIIENIVEYKILKGVVKRYSSNVNMKQLLQIKYEKKVLHERLYYDCYGKISDELHSSSRNDNSELPSYDELSEIIADLESISNEL